MPPAYGEIGKAVGDLFKGNPKSGAFNLQSKATWSGSTSTGVAVTLGATANGDKVDPSLKAAYSKGGYSADVSFDGGSKLPVNFGAANVLLPGLKLTASVALPDPNSAKASVDYSFPYLATRTTVSLTAKPAIDLVASTAFKDVILGVETGYDTAKSAISKYNVAVGYHTPDFQLAVSVLDQLGTVKVGYAHSVNSTTKVGAEVVRKLASGDTSVTLGYSKALTSGALTKLKVDNTGVLTALYETKLTTGEKIGGSFQLQATDLSKPVKYGFALDLS